MIRVLSLIALLGFTTRVLTASQTLVTVDNGRVLQRFDGLGCGAIFFEGHITSFAARQKPELQEQLYDAMFKDVRTDYLHLCIRHDHEPQNDNHDPWAPAFHEENFAYCDHLVAICEAARKRQPQMQFYATLYTPPAWMKTNNDVSGGGEARGTLKPGLELRLGEFIWAFLNHMHQRGIPIAYLSIANEPDWPHTQPSYFLTPQQHADLFAKVAAYLTEMARRHPEVPRPKLVAPNVLSAIVAAEQYLPPLLGKAGPQLDIVGTHDYDRRGNRWKTLTQAAKGRPLWSTEWCVNGPDDSPELIRSAAEYWLAMSEAFNGGANVWMAYDWVYPPRQGGEALIHVDWGNSWKLTKIYHGFRQFGSRLAPGMSVVQSTVTGAAASGISQPGVKACAFRSQNGKRIVVNIANVQEQAAEVQLNLHGFKALSAKGWRTTGWENLAALPDPPATSGPQTYILPPRGMLTVEFCE